MKKPSPISGHGKLSCRSEHKTDQPPLTAQDTAGGGFAAGDFEKEDLTN